MATVHEKLTNAIKAGFVSSTHDIVITVHSLNCLPLFQLNKELKKSFTSSKAFDMSYADRFIVEPRPVKVYSSEKKIVK
jgi:hypothetical protein